MEKEFLKRWHKREEKEYKKIDRIVKEKDEKRLRRWLEKFSIEGDFWSKSKRQKDLEIKELKDIQLKDLAENHPLRESLKDDWL